MNCLFSRYLPPDLRAIVDRPKVIQRNGYYEHSESILLCRPMLSDERPHIRELAFRRILAARKETASNSTTTVRQFRVQKLNFEAGITRNSLTGRQLIDIHPPVRKEMSDSEIN